jgi:hypothetical protein
MQIGFLMILAGVLLILAVHVQRRIAVFTLGSANIFIARLVLLVVGTLFGWIGAAAEGDTLRQILQFVIGFGIVHIPAAVILFIKGQRGAGKS